MSLAPGAVTLRGARQSALRELGLQDLAQRACPEASGNASRSPARWTPAHA